MVFAQLQGEEAEAIEMNHNCFLNFIPWNVCFAQHTRMDTVQSVPLSEKLREPEERPSARHTAGWLRMAVSSNAARAVL